MVHPKNRVTWSATFSGTKAEAWAKAKEHFALDGTLPEDIPEGWEAHRCTIRFTIEIPKV